MPPLRSARGLETHSTRYARIYVLYKAIGNRKKKEYQVFYIGVGGVSKKAASGVGGRIRRHDKTKEVGPTIHFSKFTTIFSGRRFSNLRVCCSGFSAR